MRIVPALIVIASIFIIACNQSQTSKPLDNTSADTLKSETPHQHDASEAIELNNGEKWKVDDSMMVHIRNMEKDILMFNDIKNYKKLSENLRQNIDLLTANCTMKGKAHDELHKWLLPYIDLVDEFADCKSTQEAAILFEEIKNSMVTFNQYFI